MSSAWLTWGLCIILLAVALLLQGCGLDSALHGSPHARSLLQSSDRILVSPQDPKRATAERVEERVAEQDGPRDDEDADVIDVPRLDEHHRHTRQSPGFSLLSTGSTESDSSGSADYDAIARGSDHVKKSTLDKALQMDLDQQSELQDDYAKMLYLQDPDDVDKATQLAWLKMEYEDRRLAKAMLKDDPSPKKHHLSQIQLGNTVGHRGGSRPRMLNTRHVEPLATAPTARTVEQFRAAAPAPAPLKAANPVDDADIADF
jgi:hypothetical protein